MNKGIFITGTDTEVGKTVITGLLGRFLLENGLRVATQKWIQTGNRVFEPDIGTHLKIMGTKRNIDKKYLTDMMPYTFGLPSSPHLAARMENTEINPQKIVNAFNRLHEAFDIVIAEGAGGALVPINDRELIIDIAGKLSLPAIIVAGNKLGAINHTLLTIEVLKKRDFKVLGVIFNRISKTQDDMILNDNVKIVEKLSDVEVLGEICHSKDNRVLYQNFRPIGKKIFRLIAPTRCDNLDCTS
ncbi:MAG: dethiobiotin synthase [Candidatus Omnitrophica bacterium]|nr:dethiobiotin synthase [Candidatus Omnitrophota bacterium]